MSLSSRTPNLHLLAVVGGGDSILVSHLIEHYRALGVESFLLIRHAESTLDPDYEAIDFYVKQAGLALYDTWLGPWDDKTHESRMRAVMADRPDDWFVLVDLDEFHLYDRPLPELIKLCESGGYSFAKGCYVDRVSIDGSFPDIDSRSLWEQYPLGGAVTAHLLDAIPLKVGVALGRTLVCGGHHVGGLGNVGLPRRQSYIQVHHFKWTGSVLERTRRRIQRYESGSWKLAYDKVLTDAHRLMSYVDSHGGRIDITEKRFHLRPAAKHYGSHPLWSEIVKDAARWEYD
ncbi:MAG TPA: hypothetical protein VL551_10515 [Actinospica sp.]|jgi:hypothetical protein|nr:hypothetical protein [Actinospica sp.]